MSLVRLACLGLVALQCQLLRAEDAPLLWKFNAGDVHHYQMTQNMDMNMSMGPAGAMQTGVKQVIDMTWKIDGVDDEGVATVTQSMDRVRMDMQAPGNQEMHYDTDSEEAPVGFASMVAPMLKAMTAEPFQLTMTRRGEILSAKVPESLAEAMKQTPGAAAMGEMFSEEGMKGMMQKSSLILPEPKDLVAGHSWTTEFDMKNAQFGKLAVKSTYTYRGPKEMKGKMYEAFDFDTEMDFGDGIAGVQIEVTEQDSQGEILFSREDGVLHSSTLKQSMDMAIKAGGTDMTQNIVQTVTFERVPDPKTEE